MTVDPRLNTLWKVAVSAVMFGAATLTLVTVVHDGRPPQILQSYAGSIAIYILLMIFCGYLARACWKREETVDAADATLWRVIATFFSAIAFLMFLGALVYSALA